MISLTKLQWIAEHGQQHCTAQGCYMSEPVVHHSVAKSDCHSHRHNCCHSHCQIHCRYSCDGLQNMGSSDAQAQRASIIGTIKLAQRLAAPQPDDPQAGTPPHQIDCRWSTICHVNNESEDCENNNRNQAPLHISLLLLSQKSRQ